jgi:hypothetical protein
LRHHVLVVLTQTARLPCREPVTTGVFEATVAAGAIFPYGRIVKGAEMARVAVIASGFSMRHVVRV